MKLTKFAHSCVRLDQGDRALVIDPGIFADTETALRGADAVLITHEHADHVDEAAVRTAAVADPGLAFWAPASVVAKFDDLADRFTVVEPQQDLQVAGFDVRTFGGQHAVIHPLVPVIPNIAYLVNGSRPSPGRLVHRAAFAGRDASAPVARALVEDQRGHRFRGGGPGTAYPPNP